MKNAKIVLVAEWTGWCGSCSAERPLVLTRSGGQSLRAWLTARTAPDELLVLTCRLCGVGGLVPSEDDDPEVLLEDEDDLPLPPAPAALRAVPLPPIAAGASPPSAEPLPSARDMTATSQSTASAEVRAARQLVGSGLAALLARRTAEAQSASVPLAPAASPAAVASLPLPRTSSESVRLDGIEALQLLAEGIDLLTPSRP